MLGKQIKRLRVANGMSQVDLARILEVSKQSVSNWEHDNIVPSIDTLKKICLFFNCSSDFLLGINESEHLIIDVSKLTTEQIAHIRQLANDFGVLNQKLSDAEKRCLEVDDKTTDEQFENE